MKLGLSAFLRMLCVREQPRRSLLRSRLRKAGGRGYDFHRSLRRGIRRHLIDGESIDDVLATAGDIKKPAERTSYVEGLKRSAAWRALIPGAICDVQSATFESPDQSFKVSFDPCFGIEIGGKTIAVHVWNTRSAKLVPGIVYAVLALFVAPYSKTGSRPDDLAILDVSERKPRLYRLSERRSYHRLESSIISRIEGHIRDLRIELHLPPDEKRPDQDRPPP